MILGGGPAGSASALALRRHAPHLRVALVERSDYARPRAGEVLPPAARPVLEHLGLQDAVASVESRTARGIRSTWGGALREDDFLFAARGEGWHVERARFDALLCATARERGATVFDQARHVAARGDSDHGWTLDVQQRGAPIALSARFVVDATGRAARFARTSGGAAGVRFDRLIAIACRLERTGRAAGGHFTLVEPAPHGWWYAATLAGSSAIAVFLTDSDLPAAAQLRDPRAWMDALRSTELIGPELGDMHARGGLRVHAAHTTRLEHVTGPGWLAAGDAAAAFDPLSAQGILKALRSGIHAGYSITDALAGDTTGLARYEAYATEEAGAYLDLRELHYARETRWRANPFWKRRRGELTLGATERLHAPVAATERLKQVSTLRLSAGELEHLVQLCAQPSEAHEVVSRFNAGARTETPPRRVVQALQDLLDEDVLVRAQR